MSLASEKPIGEERLLDKLGRGAGIMGQTKRQATKAVKRVRKAIESSLSEGDVDRLEQLLSELDTIRDSKAAIVSIRDLALKNYEDFVGSLIKDPSGASKNPMIWMHVINELYMRALIADYGQYIKVSNEFPLKHYSASMKEAFDGVGGKAPSFANSDSRSAKDLFTTLYENYKKLCFQFSRLSKIADSGSRDDVRRWTGIFPKEGSWYHCLSVGEVDTFIRNAISHKTFRRLQSGRYELTDRDGKVRKEFSASYLDERLKGLWAKITFSNIAMSISGIFANQMILMAIEVNKARGLRKRKRTKARKRP